MKKIASVKVMEVVADAMAVSVKVEPDITPRQLFLLIQALDKTLNEMKTEFMEAFALVHDDEDEPQPTKAEIDEALRKLK